MPIWCSRRVLVKLCAWFEVGEAIELWIVVLVDRGGSLGMRRVGYDNYGSLRIVFGCFITNLRFYIFNLLFNQSAALPSHIFSYNMHLSLIITFE